MVDRLVTKLPEPRQPFDVVARPWMQMMTRDSGADGGFEAFAQARMQALLRFAAALVDERHEAEDLVQTALARTWAAWPRVRNQNDPEGYVRRVMTNERIAQWRRVRRRAARGAVAAQLTEAPLSEPDDELALALRSLPPRQRAAVVLRYCEDRSEAETAAILGCSVGTVKSQTAKGLAHLRARMRVDTTMPEREATRHD